MHSPGFDIIEPSFIGLRNGGCGTGISACTDSAFSVTLPTSASVVAGSFSSNAPDDVAAFVGGTWATPFSQAQVRKVICGMESEIIGHVHTGNAPVMAVPEPGSNALRLGGLAGVAALMRRRLGAARRGVSPLRVTRRRVALHEGGDSAGAPARTPLRKSVRV